MKIIVLIITHNQDLYNFFDNIKVKYLKNKNIDYRLLYNSTDSNLEDKKNNKINYYTDKASIPAMLQKFLHYLERDNNYDYVIRVNSSTFLNIDRVLEEIKNHKDVEDLYMGFFDPDWIFCSGALTIFSKSVVCKLLEGKQYIQTDIEDDVAIGRFLTLKGVEKTYLERYNISDRQSTPDEEEIEEALTYPQIRIRNDFNRDVIDKGIWEIISKKVI